MARSKKRVGRPAKQAKTRTPTLTAETQGALRQVQTINRRITALAKRLSVSSLPKIPERTPEVGIAATVQELVAGVTACNSLLDAIEAEV